MNLLFEPLFGLENGLGDMSWAYDMVTLGMYCWFGGLIKLPSSFFWSLSLYPSSLTIQSSVSTCSSGCPSSFSNKSLISDFDWIPEFQKLSIMCNWSSVGRLTGIFIIGVAGWEFFKWKLSLSILNNSTQWQIGAFGLVIVKTVFSLKQAWRFIYTKYCTWKYL